MFQVDVREVLAGRMSARWCRQFVERCYHHPYAVTRARLHGDPDRSPTPTSAAPQRTWWEWYGWHYTEDAIKENSALFLSANSPPTGPPPKPLWKPILAKEQAAKPLSLDDAFTQLSAMQ